MAYREEKAEPTDEQLMLLASRGETEALGRLVRRYQGPLYGYLKRMLGNGAEAEDAFQETFLRVHAHRDRYRAPSPFRPWLYRIATNVALDRRRFWRRRPTVSLTADDSRPGPEERLASGNPGPVEHARERELEERLNAAVAELSVKHRAVFLMARYEGLSYEDIAQALGIPVGTVKSRMNKAVAFLTDRLREFLP